MCRSTPMARTTTSPELSPTRIWTGHSVRAEDRLRVLLHRLLHPERGIAGPHRVVLVGDGRPEKRHDAVAHHLVHGAVVVMDGVHHQLRTGSRSLRASSGSRSASNSIDPFEVGEEHRDLLAFPFQRRFRRQDAFGEMLRRVLLRRSTFRGRRSSGQARATFATELLAGRVASAALRAQESETTSALAAELHLGRVVVPALRAGHGHDPMGLPTPLADCMAPYD